MTIKEFFSFMTNKYFWVNILAMIAVVVTVIFISLKGLDRYTHHGEAVVVPNVKDMAVEKAVEIFESNGLTCVVSDSSYVKNKPAGIVLDVSPGVGENVKEGRIIYLTINALNIPLRPVPDVADNSSVRQAQAKILAAGFKLNDIQTVTGEKDWVYGVKYQGKQLEAGDKIPLGASLTLIIGDGITDISETDSADVSLETVEPTASESSSTQDDGWF